MSVDEGEDDAFLTCEGMSLLDLALQGSRGLHQLQKLAELATVSSETGASGYSRVCSDVTVVLTFPPPPPSPCLSSSPLTGSLCLTWSSGCPVTSPCLHLAPTQFAVELAINTAPALEVRPLVELLPTHRLHPEGKPRNFQRLITLICFSVQVL